MMMTTTTSQADQITNREILPSYHGHIISSSRPIPITKIICHAAGEKLNCRTSWPPPAKRFVRYTILRPTENQTSAQIRRCRTCGLLSVRRRIACCGRRPSITSNQIKSNQIYFCRIQPALRVRSEMRVK